MICALGMLEHMGNICRRTCAHDYLLYSFVLQRSINNYAHGRNVVYSMSGIGTRLEYEVSVIVHPVRRSFRLLRSVPDEGLFLQMDGHTSFEYVVASAAHRGGAFDSAAAAATAHRCSPTVRTIAPICEQKKKTHKTPYRIVGNVLFFPNKSGVLKKWPNYIFRKYPRRSVGTSSEGRGSHHSMTFFSQIFVI